MDLTPTDEQVQLLDAYDRLFADHANPDRVRAAEPVGFDKALWEQLLGTGAIDMAVPEGAGGWGASAVDLVLVAERFGRWVAPAPLIEAQVAARLLARLDTPAAAELLANVLAGRLVTIAPHRPRRGVARLVPGGAVADEVIVFDGTRLLRVAGHGTHVENLGAMPVADLTVGDDAAVLGEGDAARAAFDQAWDDALLLHAAALVGMGARALELGAGYATERHAFGVPIGSFHSTSGEIPQVVNHIPILHAGIPAFDQGFVHLLHA